MNSIEVADALRDFERGGIVFFRLWKTIWRSTLYGCRLVAEFHSILIF